MPDVIFSHPFSSTQPTSTLPPTVIVVDTDDVIPVDCRFHGCPVPMVTMEGDAITDNLLTFSTSDLGLDDDCYYGVSSTLQWGPETPRRNAGGFTECLGQNEVDPEPVKQTFYLDVQCELLVFLYPHMSYFCASNVFVYAYF